MANMNVNNGVFKLPIDVDSNGQITKTLQTADTYVDKNIEVTVNVPDASMKVIDEGTVSATLVSKDNTYTTDTATSYPVTVGATAKISDVKVGIGTAGYADASDTITVNGSESQEVTKTIYIKEGHLSGSGSASAVGTGITLTKVASQPSSGIYVKASGAGGASVDQAGWLPVGAAADANGDAYYTIQEATLANTATGDFTEATGPVLTEDGYLYINEGYIKPTKISLATLVPDDANVTAVNGKNDLIYNTVSVYDKDGKLIAGSMGDATFSAMSVNVGEGKVSALTVTNENGTFKATGSGSVEASASVGVATRGLATTGMTKSGTGTGNVNVSATLATVGLGVEATDADIEVTPVIIKDDATTAKAGAITKTAPTSGRYVAVNTNPVSASTNVSAKVATAGYGDTTTFTHTDATVKGGATAAGTYYVPITNGSYNATSGTPTVVKATASVTPSVSGSTGFVGDLTAGILSTAPSGTYITINTDATTTEGSVAGTVTCTTTEGYVEAGSKTGSINGSVGVDVTKTAKYIKVYGGETL